MGDILSMYKNSPFCVNVYKETRDQPTTVTSLIPISPKKEEERMIGPSKLNQEQKLNQKKPTLTYNLGNLHANQYTNNITLHEACEKGNLSIVKNILSRGLEDINCRGKLGRTPVMAAVRNGQAKVFDYLLNEGCDLLCVDDYKNNVLHVACIGGNTYIVEKLLGSGKYDIEDRGAFGRTSLMLAANYGHRDIFDLLLLNYCKVTVTDDYNYNILHMACLGGNLDMVRYVLSKNIFDIDSRGYVGRTSVMVAVIEGHKGVFKFLVSKGCNIKAVDNNENNILHLACIGGHVVMVKYILHKNIIDIESRDNIGRTSVLIAIMMNDRGVFDFLVSEGCNLKVVDDNKCNVLHLACSRGHVDMVKHLLTVKSLEGMLKVQNKYGRTPIQVAEIFGHRAVVNFLRDYK